MGTEIRVSLLYRVFIIPVTLSTRYPDDKFTQTIASLAFGYLSPTKGVRKKRLDKSMRDKALVILDKHITQDCHEVSDMYFLRLSVRVVVRSCVWLVVRYWMRSLVQHFMRGWVRLRVLVVYVLLQQNITRIFWRWPTRGMQSIASPRRLFCRDYTRKETILYKLSC